MTGTHYYKLFQGQHTSSLLKKSAILKKVIASSYRPFLA